MRSHPHGLPAGRTDTDPTPQLQKQKWGLPRGARRGPGGFSTPSARGPVTHHTPPPPPRGGSHCWGKATVPGIHTRASLLCEMTVLTPGLGHEAGSSSLTSNSPIAGHTNTWVGDSGRHLAR